MSAQSSAFHRNVAVLAGHQADLLVRVKELTSKTARYILTAANTCDEDTVIDLAQHRVNWEIKVNRLLQIGRLAGLARVLVV